MVNPLVQALICNASVLEGENKTLAVRNRFGKLINTFSFSSVKEGEVTDSILFLNKEGNLVYICMPEWIKSHVVSLEDNKIEMKILVNWE